ncbi:MAG: M15 family metallopeptidase [Ruminococcus sp.]|nr:M15 family metallopeptidase [Ruminococcus sp.]
MSRRRKKSLNGVQFFSGATVILFLAVFLLSKIQFENPIDLKGISDKSENTGTVTQKENGGEDDLLSAETVSPGQTEIGEDGIVPGDMTEDVTEPPAPATPKPDPDDADNTWAMFLVNNKNPITREYSDGFEKSEVYESWTSFYMDSRMAEYMKRMIDDAQKDGIELIVVSSYRSFDKQEQNIQNSIQDRMDRLGMTEEEARIDTLREVQSPGCSEHNAGIAADIMSNEYISMDDDGFKNTEAFSWLRDHAADYGFILRYPEDGYESTGITYEPWHYRFVGVYYAKIIKDKGITLEEYFEEMNWVDDEGTAVYHLPVLG